MRKVTRRFDPPLDVGVREYVEALVDRGVVTFESCEGGDGHAYTEPTVRFHGDRDAGRRAFAVCRDCGFPVAAVRRTWPVVDGRMTGPHWELVFDVPVRRPGRDGRRGADGRHAGDGKHVHDGKHGRDGKHGADGKAGADGRDGPATRPLRRARRGR
jgi:hypothetical protein